MYQKDVGSQCDLQHALSCKKGGFVSQRQEKDQECSTTRLMSEVCTDDVKVEPPLQQLSGEVLAEKTANRSDEARLDISSRGSWITGQRVFFDIRVFNPLARRYSDMDVKKMYVTNEREKKRHQNERVLMVEQGTFSPLVF